MSESVVTITKQGDKFWSNSKGELHRTDGPAVEYKNGDKYWYKNDSLHRINGPAIEGLDGYKEWWLNGELLGYNDKGFWRLWDRLTPEQKKDTVLLSYLPE